MKLEMSAKSTSCPNLKYYKESTSFCSHVYAVVLHKYLYMTFNNVVFLCIYSIIYIMLFKLEYPLQEKIDEQRLHFFVS